MHRHGMVKVLCAILDQVGTSCNRPFGVTLSTGPPFLSRGGPGTPQGKILARTLKGLSPIGFRWQTIYKQLLDEVFVISRIIKVEVEVISQSRRPICFCFFTDGKQAKVSELDMITRDLECP